MRDMTFTNALRLARGLDKTAELTPQQRAERGKRIGTMLAGNLLGGLGSYTLLKLIRPNLGWGATTAGTILGAIGGGHAANYIRDKMNEGSASKENQTVEWALNNPAKAVVAHQAGKRLGKPLVKAGPDMLPALLHPVDAAVGAGGKLFTNYLKSRKKSELTATPQPQTTPQPTQQPQRRRDRPKDVTSLQGARSISGTPGEAR